MKCESYDDDGYHCVVSHQQVAKAAENSLVSPGSDARRGTELHETFLSHIK